MEGRAPRQRHDAGDLAIRIARDGTWYYRGSPIARKEMVCLFGSVLKRGADGSYILETPVERGRIEVEDAPFIAVELFWRDCDCGHLDPVSREPRPYITVRPGLEARINRAVFYELVALAQPETLNGRQVLGVWSEGMFFPIDEAPILDMPEA
ncbi:MAG: DUF1285 domain-containing protein [Acetobacteraceae bacterium]|nr:DUF1285 domain-containing protein [Acetobacteraceae bacterium]